MAVVLGDELMNLEIWMWKLYTRLTPLRQRDLRDRHEHGQNCRNLRNTPQLTTTIYYLAKFSYEVAIEESFVILRHPSRCPSRRLVMTPLSWGVQDKCLQLRTLVWLSG